MVKRVNAASRSEIEFDSSLRMTTDLLAIAGRRPWSAGTALSTGCAGLVSIARRASPLCWETRITVAGGSRLPTRRTKAPGPIVATR
jgi:hypothetical protein